MKKIIFASLLFAGMSIFSACDNTGKHEGNDTTTTSTNGGEGNSDNSGASTQTGGGSTGGTGADTVNNNAGSASGNNVNNTIGNSSTATDTTGRMGGNTGAHNGTGNMDKATTDFISKAASGGMMEVELGNMAAQKAQNQRVKNFGSMMVIDHTQANKDLKNIASGKNITMPTAMLPEHQRHVDMIKNKTGADFDKAYMKMMLDDHKKDVNEFKQASTTLKNADIKGFASRTLPVLQKHLDSAQAINAKM
jgi:putative membrane protein